MRIGCYKPRTIEDQKIIELIRTGNDRTAIALLYKKVLPQLKSYLSRNKGNRDDAYDVFHDALMIFYEQVLKNEFDPKYNIAGYLYRLSVFRWINKVKKDRSMVLVEEYPEAVLYSSSQQYDLQEATQDNNLLQQLFGQIGSKCIELLQLTIYSDMLMEDIAVRMGFTSVEATRMQHMRCKKKLLSEIETNPNLLQKLRGALPITPGTP